MRRVVPSPLPSGVRCPSEPIRHGSCHQRIQNDVGLAPWSGSRDMVMINVQGGAQEGTTAVSSCVRYVPALSTICLKNCVFPFAVACSIACCCHIIQKPPPVCRTGPFTFVPERPFPSHVDLCVRLIDTQQISILHNKVLFICSLV